MTHPTNPVQRAKRYIFSLCAAIVCLLMVLFLPPVQQPADTQKSYLDYDQLVLGKPNDLLAVDELEPDRYAVNVPSIDNAKIASSREAEMALHDGIYPIDNSREGYRGSGYVSLTDPDTESAVCVSMNVPSAQHYDITICMAADRTVTNALRINDNLLTEFTLEGNPHFVRVTFYGIFLEEGSADITIDTIDGGIDLDYFEMTSESTVLDVEFSIADAPCDPDATVEARELYTFLTEHWNEQIITGQYASDGSNRELALIYEMTGQLPVIRFSALGDADTPDQIEAAMDWHLYTGGVVGLMWHWNAPGSDTVYAEQTDFSLVSALSDTDIDLLAVTPYDEAATWAAKDEITDECLMLLRDIDDMAAQLRKFDHMGIPILWRPLHEAGGGWFWWGADGASAYTQLWKLLYTRFTEYHDLHHLIWIWNGQSDSYLVPSDSYDIASVDIYLHPTMEYGSRYEQFVSLSRITNGQKLLALSECSSLPDIEMLLLDRTIWSFFGLWYGEYIMQSDGSFSDLYYSSSDLYKLYNSDRAMSLNDFRSMTQ